ncbi:MAG TPA: sigma-54 dependent transcriptional regulator [Vicinamibacterales bacterium]|jgi:two-component system response regulator HydG|nr:sigma-54 dependent transcriptional regulator [Vicinamibacterales bacterium]
MIPSSEEPIALVGLSRSLEALRGEVEYASRCDAKVLITGESGVGKEVVARLIHGSSRRNRVPLVTVNCAALTETLLETELFGHVRGSFTGAIRDRTGVLEQANRGTVFMDEIGETTPRMQGLLLRFMETGEIQRVGSDRADSRVDVRVIAATNRDLLGSVQDKTFREDLYYRLNVINIHVPPLRERMEDLETLLSRFLQQFSRTYRLQTPTVSPEAMELLRAYTWPGNVRELKNLAERLVVRGGTGTIEPQDLPVEIMRRPTRAQDTPAPATSRADELFDRMVVHRESFWTAVYAPFMLRDLTRDDLRGIVKNGLERASGNPELLLALFNMRPEDGKRFWSMLKKHDCQPAAVSGRSPARDTDGADAPEKLGAATGPGRGSDWPAIIS